MTVDSTLILSLWRTGPNLIPYFPVSFTYNQKNYKKKNKHLKTTEYEGSLPKPSTEDKSK